MADNIADATRQEQEQSIQNQQKLIDAYNSNPLQSYQAAQQNAYDSALPDGVGTIVPGPGGLGALFGAPVVAGSSTSLLNIGKRKDMQFIQKVRSVANIAYQDRQTQEQGRLQQAYNLIAPPTGPIGSFVDMPIRITDALGRSIGTMMGNAQTSTQQVATNILGTSGALFAGINKADQYVTAGLADISKIVTESPYIEKAIKGIKNLAPTPVDISKVSTFMGGVNSIYASSFRKVMMDLADILNSWYHDPRTLCCLIKSLAALAQASADAIKGKAAPSINDEMKLVVSKYFNGNGTANLVQLSGTQDFFDKMIAILKIIRTFLTQDLNFNLALNLDLGLSMSKASIGALMALLTSLQQMLQDKIYTKLMDWVNKEVGSGLRQCLPFEKLIRLIASWMTVPDGLFKYIEQLVDAYMVGFQTNMQYGFNKSDKLKHMDVAALDKLIDLLTQLRDAMLKMELCIEADFNQPSTPGTGQPQSDNSAGIAPGNYNDLVNQITNKATGNPVTYPTDREITAFLVNRLGESPEFAQQVLASANAGSNLSGTATGSPDNAGGSSVSSNLSTALGDCAQTLTPSRINSLADLIAGWEII